MVMNVYAIIIIHKYDPISIEEDELRFRSVGFKDCRLVIPKIRYLKRVVFNKEEWGEKPLLFRYGFMELPIEIARNPVHLNLIREKSRCISNFVYRRATDLEQEMLRIVDQFGTDNILRKQVIVETISGEEILTLQNYARSASVYHNTTQLSVGSFIILRGYPLDNVPAEIVEKFGKTIKVKVLSTGYVISVQEENLYYSPYEDDEEGHYQEISFTELGYIPDV